MSEVMSTGTLTPVQMELLLGAMVYSNQYAYLNQDDELSFDDFLDNLFRKSSLRSVAESFKRLKGDELNLVKVSSDLQLPTDTSEWERLVVFFQARNSLVYHRLVEMFYCGDSKKQDSFERMGMLYLFVRNCKNV